MAPVKTLTLAAAAAALSCASAASAPANKSRALAEGCVHDEALGTLPWTYNPMCWGTDVTPANDWWANTHEDYSACAGVRQSPINIDSVTVPLTCASDTLAGVIFDNGSCTFGQMTAHVEHSMEMSYEEGCGDAQPSFYLNGQTYKLKQMHLHALSEHTWNGEHVGAELHFVHYNEANPTDLLVIGVGINELPGDDFDTEFDKYLDIMNEAIAAGVEHRRTTTTYTAESLYNEVSSPYDLLPEDHTYFTYLGSLTVPPCSEIVTWVVMATPISISSFSMWAMRYSMMEQYGAFLDAYGNNNRPLMPLNDRVVSQCTF